MPEMKVHLDQPQFGDEALVSSGQQDCGEVHGFEEHQGGAGLHFKSRQRYHVALKLNIPM